MYNNVIFIAVKLQQDLYTMAQNKMKECFKGKDIFEKEEISTVSLLILVVIQR